MFKTIFAAILISFVLTSCSTEPNTNIVHEDSTSVIEEKVGAAIKETDYSKRYIDTIFTKSQIITEVRQYSTAPDYSLTAYYAPPKFDTARSKCWVVWLHGGGKDMNDKSVKNYCEYLAQLGFAAVAINYPSGDEDMGKFTPETQKQAVFSLWTCLNYIRANAAPLRVNPDMAFSAGQSAGAITVYQGNIGSWVYTTNTYFREWTATPNPHNLGYPVTVLGSATLSGAANGTFEKWIPKLQSPNGFYTGADDKKIPANKQIDQFNLMISSRIPNMNSLEWRQIVFGNTAHVLNNFPIISRNIQQQFYSIIKPLPTQ